MREYNRAAARFWTGTTGRAIRAKGKDAQILAIYLFTSPHMNMIGLYYLPIPTMTYETGLTEQEVRTALAALEDVGFAQYDEHDELVFLPTAAVHQVGEELDPKDNRAKGVKALLYPHRHHRFARQFIERYKSAYSLRINTPPKPLPSPLEAPPKQGGGEGRRRRGGDGEGTNPPPQTPPPTAEGPARENAEADPWALPPGLTTDQPNGSVPTIAGAPLRRALERLIAGEAARGREVGDVMRKKLRKRLAGGALEHDLARQLKEAGERRQRETAEEQAREKGYDDALQWIRSRGGNDAVIAEARAHLEAYPPAHDIETQDVLRQWANQAHAPPEVVTYILPTMYAQRRKTATGG